MDVILGYAHGVDLTVNRGNMDAGVNRYMLQRLDREGEYMDTQVKGWKSMSLHTTQLKQTYYDEWTKQVETVTYAGRCVLCGYTTYLKSSGNDPRGFTGLHHTADPLVASEYDMVGPDVPACYDCHSNNGESYRKLLDIAKSNYWRTK